MKIYKKGLPAKAGIIHLLPLLILAIFFAVVGYFVSSTISRDDTYSNAETKLTPKTYPNKNYVNYEKEVPTPSARPFINPVTLTPDRIFVNDTVGYSVYVPEGWSVYPNEAIFIDSCPNEDIINGHPANPPDENCSHISLPTLLEGLGWGYGALEYGSSEITVNQNSIEQGYSIYEDWILYDWRFNNESVDFTDTDTPFGSMLMFGKFIPEEVPNYQNIIDEVLNSLVFLD